MAAAVLPQAMSFASFGAEQGGRQFSARTLLDGPRYRMLDRRQSFYECTLYDSRMYDFEGRVIAQRAPAGGMSATQPMLSQGPVPYYVPLAARRPSNPYRLPRVIVNAYTTLLFGEQRFPHVKVTGDEDTQDWLQTICRVGRLPIQMIRARNIGGSTGTVAIGWCFRNGAPQFTVHNAKNLQVLEWEDRESLIPAHVVECFQFHKDEWDAARRKIVRNWYWYRRDWTTDADLVYPEMPVRGGEEPRWAAPDPKLSTEHKDGKAHLEWIQNFPTDDIDGAPDYEGLYDNFEVIDLVSSIIARGAILNLDPTLKLKVDPNQIAATGGVRKGSDNALMLGLSGDAEYMELSGQSLESGIKLFDSMRRAALEVAQCIVPDPNEVAAQGVSSVAIKAMYAPMLARVDQLQEQYGHPLERMLTNIAEVGRKASRSRVTVVDPESGAEEEASFAVVLPPRVETTPVLDADGKPTGEDRVTKVDRHPGEGGELQAVWPPRFQATPTDLASVATTMTAATGGKAFLSRQTSVEVTARYLNIDPDEEWRRIEKQTSADHEQAEAMFQGASDAAGGRVDHELELPGGAKIRKSAEPALPEAGPEVPEPAAPAKDDEEAIKLTSSDLANIVTVNEARASVGLGPIAGGELTIVEFKAQRASTVARAASADKGTDPDEPKPAPPAFGGGPPGSGFPPKKNPFDLK